MKRRVTTYPFDKSALKDIESHPHGSNWPVVYILENGEEAYIGETTSATRRTQNHLDNQARDRFNTLCLIADQAFNKSATLDLESKLIEYMAADGAYRLQNSNRGMRNHNYFEKQKYNLIFEEVWQELQTVKITKQDLRAIQNSDLFKFSPYKSLTEDQAEIVESLENIFKSQKESISIVQGEPGSGKTILAIYLAKYLTSIDGSKPLRMGLVLPQTALRKTVGRIFKSVKGLKANMVMGPSEVVKSLKDGPFDLLIVDEAHRLNQRRNLTNYIAFDNTSTALGLDPQAATQLHWILKTAKHVVLLYDPNQSVKPSDVDASVFQSLVPTSNYFKLTSQLRALAGSEYPAYLESVLKNQNPRFRKFENYDLKLYQSLQRMVEQIKQNDKAHQLSRLVAGYAWEWKSKYNRDATDIKIGEVCLKWNSTIEDWINSENAINEVGCIHTVQGYDLNYAGVIIGPELKYRNGNIVFDTEQYKDRYGKHTSKSSQEMLHYILNIYKTLMTRGIKGTYLYACDEALFNYLAQYFEVIHDYVASLAAE